MVGLREIEMTTPRLQAAAATWRRLTESVDEPIRLTDDVRLCLHPGEHEAFCSLTFALRNLLQVRGVLAGRGLLEASPGHEVLLSLAASGGMRIRFVQTGFPIVSNGLL